MIGHFVFIVPVCGLADGVFKAAHRTAHYALGLKFLPSDAGILSLIHPALRDIKTRTTTVAR